MKQLRMIAPTIASLGLLLGTTVSAQEEKKPGPISVEVLPAREIVAKLGDDARVKNIGFVKGLRYILPMQWEKERPANPMRLVQVKIHPLMNEALGPGLLVISGGIGGSVEDNVARWVAQFSELEGVATQQDLILTGTPLTVTEVIATGTFNAAMPGAEPDFQPHTTLYGAIVQGGPEGLVFIKATGPKETMAERRSAWDIFIRNLKVMPRPKDAPLPKEAPDGQPPAGEKPGDDRKE